MQITLCYLIMYLTTTSNPFYPFDTGKVCALKLNLCCQREDYGLVIYERGCLRAGEEWVERNLVPVAGVGVAVSVMQVSYRSTSIIRHHQQHTDSLYFFYFLKVSLILLFRFYY